MAHQCAFVHSQSRKTAGRMVRTTCAETPWWRRCFNRGTRLSSTQKPLRTNVSGRLHQTPLSVMRTVPDIQPFSVCHHLAHLSSGKRRKHPRKYRNTDLAGWIWIHDFLLVKDYNTPHIYID